MRSSVHRVALAVLVLAAASACSNTSVTAANTVGGTRSASAAGSAGAGGVPAPPPTSVSSSPVGAPSSSIVASTAAAGRTCLAHVSILYPVGDNPLRSTCVRVGGSVDITLTAIGGYRWSVPVSSNPAVAVIANQYADPTSGTLRATVTVRGPGTTTLSATQSLAAGGPPRRLWTLILAGAS